MLHLPYASDESSLQVHVLMHKNTEIALLPPSVEEKILQCLTDMYCNPGKKRGVFEHGNGLITVA